MKGKTSEIIKKDNIKFKKLKFEELIEFIGSKDKKINIKVGGKALKVNSYQPPTGEVKRVGIWINENITPLKNCNHNMTSFRLKSLYYETTGRWCSRTDIKVAMEMLGYKKAPKGTEDYYYNCKVANKRL